jgi:hypothetical protein
MLRYQCKPLQSKCRLCWHAWLSGIDGFKNSMSRGRTFHRWTDMAFNSLLTQSFLHTMSTIYQSYHTTEARRGQRTLKYYPQTSNCLSVWFFLYLHQKADLSCVLCSETSYTKLLGVLKTPMKNVRAILYKARTVPWAQKWVRLFDKAGCSQNTSIYKCEMIVLLFSLPCATSSGVRDNAS